MGELILHIGTPKTGTTSLQKFLFDNREILAKNGVDYVQFTPQQKEAFAKWRNGCFLSRYCRALASKEEISTQVSDFEENYKRLTNALKGSCKALLSDENFYGFATLAYEGFFNPAKYWSELAHIVKELGVNSITIIVYLRRQDEYAVSQWKESIKNGYSKQGIKDYINQPFTKCRLDYASVIDAIKEAFDHSANIIVRSYNQVASSQNGIYHDFCESLGIAWDSNFKIPKQLENESIPFDMAEALRTCKYGTKGNKIEEKRVRNRLAVALGKQHPDPKGTTVFSQKESAELMEQYSDGNRRIEDEYFGNNSLFSDEYQAGPMWHPNKLRIAEYRLAFICPKMLLRLRSAGRSMRKTINKYKNRVIKRIIRSH